MLLDSLLLQVGTVSLKASTHALRVCGAHHFSGVQSCCLCSCDRLELECALALGSWSRFAVCWLGQTQRQASLALFLRAAEGQLPLPLLSG